MEANYTHNNFEIKDDTSVVEVPDDDSAKLMYYLYCVSTVLEYDGLGPFTDYKGYQYMPSEYLNTLIKLALLFDPKLMVAARVFVEVPSLDMINRFYEIKDERMDIHVDEEIVIGGVTTRVKEIMAFKPSFLLIYYYYPLLNLTLPEEPIYTYKNEPIYKPISIPVYERVKIPVYEPVKIPVYQPVNTPVPQQVNKPVYQTFNKKREEGKCCLIF